MNFDTRFSSENMLLSVLGHLVLAALMVTSFAVVVHRATLVAPDRIEILEIDLNSVTVSGDETILRNENADADVAEPESEPEPESQPVAQPESEPAPEPDSEPEPIVAPTLVEQKPTAPKIPEPTVRDVKKPADEKPEPAPKKKKRVIRVNREVMSLDRTMTVSVVDALRVAMTRCWSIDTSRDDIGDIRAVAHLTMRRNGTVRDVWFESAARAETDPGFAYVLETIRSAINTCQPFKMLPANEFDKWEKIQLTFYPTQGKVM